MSMTVVWCCSQVCDATAFLFCMMDHGYRQSTFACKFANAILAGVRPVDFTHCTFSISMSRCTFVGSCTEVYQCSFFKFHC